MRGRRPLLTLARWRAPPSTDPTPPAAALPACPMRALQSSPICARARSRRSRASQTRSSAPGRRSKRNVQRAFGFSLALSLLHQVQDQRKQYSTRLWIVIIDCGQVEQNGRLCAMQRSIFPVAYVCDNPPHLACAGELSEIAHSFALTVVVQSWRNACCRHGVLHFVSGGLPWLNATSAARKRCKLSTIFTTTSAWSGTFFRPLNPTAIVGRSYTALRRSTLSWLTRSHVPLRTTDPRGKCWSFAHPVDAAALPGSAAPHPGSAS